MMHTSPPPKTRSAHHRGLSAVSRRSLLAGLGATLVAPRIVRAQVSSNPDVVVIGAGAAGLAATGMLMERGVEATLIEASSRIGGRAYTETTTFGVPYDHGAHWLHVGASNPFVAYGRKHGFDIYPAPDVYRVFDGDRELGAREKEALWNAWDEVYGAIGAQGDRGNDISAAEAAAGIADPWAATAAFGIGPWSMGKDLEDFSVVDWWSGADGADWYCREGFGALIAHWAGNIPVSLNTKATRIDWSGEGVIVETDQGSIRARAVVVTVSTGVMASGAIVFSPVLPARKQESFERISMGLYNHITLQFSEDVFGMGPDGYLLFRMAPDRRGFGVLTNAGGHGLAYCDVGGSWARDLEEESAEARIDYAMGELRGMLGSGIDSRFVKGAVTSWGQNPLTLGSYASAEPGAHDMRSVLRQPVGDRIFFAGEACHRSLWATAAGARLSGEEVARDVARKLN